jgi:CBS domain-containing protein
MTESDKGSSGEQERRQLEATLASSSKDSLGVIHLSFLMESIGGLTKKLPLCIDQNLNAQMVVEQLLERKVGSALLVDENGKAVGIFTERDYLKHFANGQKDAKQVKIKDVSTMDPITVPPDTSIAYALNLMSHGGFRHLPVVDEEGKAIGVVSVRDVLDRISELLVQDLMSF